MGLSWIPTMEQDSSIHQRPSYLARSDRSRRRGIGVPPFLPLADSGCIYNGSSDPFDACGVLHDNTSRIGLHSSVLE